MQSKANSLHLQCKLVSSDWCYKPNYKLFIILSFADKIFVEHFYRSCFVFLFTRHKDHFSVSQCLGRTMEGFPNKVAPRTNRVKHLAGDRIFRL